MTISVLVADDQPLMRGALQMCLAGEPDIEVAGEAADGQQAIELATRLRPDVLVMDIRMPTLDGIAATRQLVAADGGVRVIVITTFDLDEYVFEALRAGASGFLVKDATAEELVQAVRVVAAGDALISPAVTRRLLDRYAERLFLPVEPERGEQLQRLTSRELAVLKLVAGGLSNAQIGRVLHVADSSVKTHVSHVLAKLGLTDRVQLVIFAYESGLLRPGATSVRRSAVPEARPGVPADTDRQPSRRPRR